MDSRGQYYLFSDQFQPAPHWKKKWHWLIHDSYSSTRVILKDCVLLLVFVILKKTKRVLILSPWLCWTQTGGGGMRLYGGCVDDVFGVSVRSSSLSSSTDSSEFSSSSSSSDSSASKRANVRWLMENYVGSRNRSIVISNISFNFYLASKM